MKPKRLRFRPPKPLENPELVQITWVDAVYDTEHDGPAREAGGLVLLPSCGYFVRLGNDPVFGRFIVLAREFSKSSTGELHSRHELTVHVDWIKSWSVVKEMKQIWPPVEETKE